MAATEHERLRVGVVGIGHWGPNFVRNLAQHGDTQLTAVCDCDEGAFERVSIFLPEDCKCVTEAAEVFASPDVDAVVIATPASTHYELAKAALAGDKHVLCIT